MRLRQRLRQIPHLLDTPAPVIEILSFSIVGTSVAPVLAVRPCCRNEHYAQVYFDTTRAIQEVCARCTCEFRFYEELNDYLPPEQRKRTITREITGTPSVKDAIESLGVPHTEIDLILVDGRSVRFDRRLRGGERVAVYPEFERFDITPIHRLRPKPLREPRFVADVHLGTLARYLRLLGFDTRYGNDLADAELAALTSRETRILLTRDVGLLKRKAVVRGQWLRSRDPERQVRRSWRRCT